MRKVAVTAVVALGNGVIGAMSIATRSQAAPIAAQPRTVELDVVFSPFTLIANNNARDPGASTLRRMATDHPTTSEAVGGHGRHRPNPGATDLRGGARCPTRALTPTMSR